MKKKVKVSPSVSLRMFFKGRMYKLYKENDLHDYFILDTNSNDETEVKEFLDSILKMRFINSYEFVAEENTNSSSSAQDQQNSEQAVQDTQQEVQQSSEEQQPTKSSRRKKSN